MYEERVGGLRRHMSELPELGSDVLASVGTMLDAILVFDQRLSKLGYPTLNDGRSLQQTVEATLEDLLDAIASASRRQLLNWVAAAGTTVGDYLGRLLDEKGYNESTVALLRGVREEALAISQRVMVVIDSESLKERLEEANQVVDDIKEAAGVAGEAANISFYRTYAAEELKAASGFRVAAITLIGLTVGIAAFYSIWELTHPPDQPDWQAVVYRSAILVGIGALSAYLARQAGQHRRLYNWANALEVQLQSFAAFTAPMNVEERQEIRLFFARRVLGSPPDPKTGESTDDTVPAAQLLDVAMTALRKSP